MILGERGNGFCLESLECFYEKRSTTFGSTFKERSRRITRSDIPYFLHEYMSFIHSETHLLYSKSSYFFSIQEGVLDRGGTTIFWEQGCVDIEKAHRRNIQELLREDFPVSHDDTNLGIEVFDFL